jgi:hypothetical protein
MNRRDKILTTVTTIKTKHNDRTPTSNGNDRTPTSNDMKYETPMIWDMKHHHYNTMIEHQLQLVHWHLLGILSHWTRDTLLS